jgi:S1-C subfamily serine protease
MAISGKQRCYLLCQSVRPNSVAEVAGLRVGDRIVRVNAWEGASVTCRVTLKDALGGQEAKVTFQRGPKTLQASPSSLSEYVQFVVACLCLLFPGIPELETCFS